MADHLHALRPGTVIDGYEIVSFLGSGGFGITYLGRDVALDKPVAIKEYMPSDLAVRQQTLTVSPKSGQDRADFDWGLDRFLDEARTLARFDHPNVVKVSRFFRDHGTAYIVMEHVSGETLSEVLQRKGRLGEAELRGLVEGLLSGLGAVHAADYLHRDIKPGNVILRPDGTPVLLDFGSARQSVTAKSRSVTAIVTPGYAPIEQYSSRGNQGPWTDIYAVGAICYRAMTGEVPVDATERVRRDPLVPVSEHPVSKGAYSADLCAAVDEALRVDEDARPQDVAAWRAFLSGEQAPTEKLAPAKPADPVASPAQKDRRGGLAAAGIFALVLGASGAALLIDPMGWFDPQKVASGEPALEAPADTETASIPVDEPAPAIPEIDEEPAPAVLAADPPAPDLMGTTSERLAILREIQSGLERLGHYTSVIDGSAGPATQQAADVFSGRAGIAPVVLRDAGLEALVAFKGRVRQAATEYERRESAAWGVATAADTRAGYEAYLAEFARGANTAEALERIAAIDAASISQADDQAWAAAQRTDTKAAYEAYLRAQPSGRHAAEARAKITEIDRLEARGPGTVFRDKFTSGSGQGPEMVVLPSGSFTMGSPEGEAGRTFDEGPQRTVRIGYEFAVAKYEVTFAEWDSCAVDGGCGGHRPNDRGWGRNNHPVINVSWSDAQSYVAWLNQKTGLTGRVDRYRLLSEAEWEYAARAGSQAPWSFGDDESRLESFAWFKPNSEARTQPVGGKTANAFSLHDMHGNVWEWVEDTDGWNYRNAPSDGSARLTSNIYRVVRGGSWNNSTKELRSAYRYIFTPGSRKINVGFRVARTLPP